MPAAIPDMSNEFDVPKITVSVWVKSDNTYNGRTILYIGDPDANDNHLDIRWITGGGASIRAAGLLVGEVGTTGLPFTGAGEAGIWYHLVVTVADMAVKLYLDGQLVNSGGNGLTSPAGQGSGVFLGRSMWVGSHRNGPSLCLTGNINDVAIFDNYLSPEAITAIYNGGCPTNLTVDSGDYTYSEDLVGYWLMGDTLDPSNPGTTIPDKSVNSNHGTLFGGSTFLTLSEDVPCDLS